MAYASLDSILNPKSVAVVGASDNPMGFGYNFMTHLKSYGFKGDIYPINPKSDEVLGIKAYKDLEDVPGDVDYVIHAIGVHLAPMIIQKASKKNAKCVHVFAGRGAETGRPEAKQLEADILKLGKELEIRLIGPNCLGLYNPTCGLSFGYDFPLDAGPVGALIQSGGNSTDLVHIGALRGVRFSKVVSYGNALDMNQNDFLRYFTDDPDTKVIVGFIEGLRGDSREFMDLLRKATAKKPVILCKGGRTDAGARLTVSHTASLAGSGKIWETAVRQAGAIPVRDLDELINMAVAFSMIPPIKGNRVGIAGCGGGRSVISVDEWADNGFEVPALPESIRQEFKTRGSQIWDWIGNPADVSIVAPNDPFTMPAIVDLMLKHEDFDFVSADAQEDPPFSETHFIASVKENIEGYVQNRKENEKPLLMVFDERSVGITEHDSWNYRTRAEMRTYLVKEKMPFFPSVDEAARAVNEIIKYYNRKEEMES
jgi:acyl-CoA synthetase (NDP forming)